MKTKTLLLFSILTFTCSCNNYSNLSITYFSMNANSTISIENETLIKKIQNNDSFILYIGNHSCSTCNLVSNHLSSIIKKTHIVIYNIEYSIGDNNYLSLYEKINLPYIEVNEAPAFIFFKNGNYELHKYDSNIFFSETKLSQLIFSNYDEKGIYYINPIVNNKIVDDISYLYSFDKTSKIITYTSTFDHRYNSLYLDMVSLINNDEKVYIYDYLSYDGSYSIIENQLGISNLPTIIEY